MWKTKREARLTKKFMLSSIVTTRMKKRQEKKLIDPKEEFLDQRARNVNKSDSNLDKNLENILCALTCIRSAQSQNFDVADLSNKELQIGTAAFLDSRGPISQHLFDILHSSSGLSVCLPGRCYEEFGS